MTFQLLVAKFFLNDSRRRSELPAGVEAQPSTAERKAPTVEYAGTLLSDSISHSRKRRLRELTAWRDEMR
jgi:hypothetical protein